MVALDIIESSDSLINTSLPPNLVAVFVGATNGVGETTLRQFAKHTSNLHPRVYIVGRSQEAGDRIITECKALNPTGTFTFLQRDTSLIHNVDAVCDEISSKEESINLLFLTIGTLQHSTKTAEGLHYPMALTVYARHRFTSNLLSLIQNAKGLKRVVTVYGATFEGKIHMSDFEGYHLSRPANMAQTASILTLSLESFQKRAPEVSFVHNFPGAVESGIARGSIGPLMRFLKTVWAILGPLVHIPLVEAGERHLYLCTSARYPARGGEDGVPLDGVAVARGVDGQPGSGVYSIDANGESASISVEKTLAKLRGERMVQQVQERIEADINNALASGKGSRRTSNPDRTKKR